MHIWWLLIGLTVITISGVTAALLLRGQGDDHFHAHRWTGENGGVLPYRLFVPTGLENDASPLPLVIYLHGAGSRGDDNRRQLETGARHFAAADVQARHPSIVLAPQCPAGTEWVLHGFDSLPFGTYRIADLDESPHNRMLLALIDRLCTELPIDPARIYLTGFSMGASGVYDLIGRHPQRFAAAVPVSGVNDPTAAARLVELPLRIYHGGKDHISPLANAEALVSAIRAAGGSRVELVRFADGEHDVTGQAYGDPALDEWLFTQRRPAGGETAHER